MSALNGRIAAGQIRGDRDQQEDDFGISEVVARSDSASGETLMVLADGMGGHAGGARASELAVRHFIESYQVATGPVPDRLRAALEEANAALASEKMASPEFEAMGCTLLAVVISSNGVEWLSVGDSPLWLLEGDGLLRRLNADHSMAPVLDAMVQMGRLDPEDAANDGRRNELRSAVNGERIDLVDVASQPVGLKEHNRLLLASDGIETLAPTAIAELIGSNRGNDLEQVVEGLLAAVQSAEQAQQDNTTVLLYEADRALTPSSNSPEIEEPAPEVIEPDQPREQAKRGALPRVLLACLILTALGLGWWLGARQHRDQAMKIPDVETGEQKLHGKRDERLASEAAEINEISKDLDKSEREVTPRRLSTNNEAPARVPSPSPESGDEMGGGKDKVETPVRMDVVSPEINGDA